MGRRRLCRIYFVFLLLFLTLVPVLAQEQTQAPSIPTDTPVSDPTIEPSLSPEPSETLATSFTLVPSETDTTTATETASQEASATEESFSEFGTSFSASPDDSQNALATNLAYIADFETSSLPAGTIRDTDPVLFGFPNPTLIGGGINNSNVNGLYANTFLRNQSTPVTVHMSVQVDLGGQARQVTNLFRWGIAWRNNFSLAGKIFNGYITFEDATGTVIAQSTVCAIQASAPAPCVVSIDLSLRNVYSVTAHLEAPNMTASGTNFVEWALDNVYVPTTSIYVPPSPSPVPTVPSCGTQGIGIQQTCEPKVDLLLELDAAEELQLRQVGEESILNITVTNQNFSAPNVSPSIAGNVQVTILLPIGLSYTSPPDAIIRTNPDGSLLWEVGPLYLEGGTEPHSKTLELTLRVEENAITEIEGLSTLGIFADARSNGIEFDEADNTATLNIEAVHPYCRYAIARGNARSYRAPITNNPPNYPEGSRSPVDIPYSPSYHYIVNATSSDYLAQTWYRVTAVIVSNQVITPENYIELYTDEGVGSLVGEGIDPAGFWIKSVEVGGLIGDANCQNSLMNLSQIYDVEPLAWNSWTAFSSYPVDLSALCMSGHLDLDSLGINPQNVNNYPRQSHNGLDFYVPADTHARSMADGLVVGIGYAEEAERTHAIWGASTLTSGVNGNAAYSVIIRHGHFYVLYGHLQELPDTIWVGASVISGQDLGLIGEFNTRHLHVEVHSFGEQTTTAPAYNPAHDNFDEPLDASGILPVGGQGGLNVPPYVYDLLQLLPPEPPNSQYPAVLNLSNLTQLGTSTEYRTNLNINNCTFNYRTDLRPPVVVEIEIASIFHRGFVSFNFQETELGNQIVSPFISPNDK